MIRFLVVVTIAIGFCFAVQPSFAGTSNSVPFKDNFESYTNGTPLIDGINGWYASSAKVVVQTDVVKRAGVKTAMIPEETTLSNRFENVGTTNVWIQMDVRPVRSDGTDTPDVDTNATAMFYVNGSGYFVVHDGSPTNFVVVTDTVAGAPAMPVPENGWVRIHVYQNYANKTWTLFASRALLKQNIRFINAGATGFQGFDLQNCGGGGTTYVDNVAVIADFPEELRASNWLPDLMVGTNVLIGAVRTEETAEPTGF